MKLFVLIVLFSVSALAQDVVLPADFFSQVLQAIKDFGGLSVLLKISAVITLIVSSMKVSYLNQLIWSRLGSLQVYLAPVLGLIGGALGLGVGGVPVTAASVFAYVSAGAGAVFIHEILDTLKKIPGIGPVYVTIIDLISGALKGPASKP